MNFLKFSVRVAVFFAIAGFVLAGGYGAIELIQREYVREFQAGAASPVLERLSAIAQRAAIEGTGFGVLAGLLASISCALGCLLSPLMRNCKVHCEQTNATGGVFFLAIAAFVIWITTGTWLGNEFVAFLDVKSSLLLSFGGFFVTFFGILVYAVVIAKTPFAKNSGPTSTGLFAGLSAFFLVWLADDLLLKTSGGWRSPMSLGIVGFAFLASIPAVGFLGSKTERFLPSAVQKIVELRFLPRSVSYILSISLIVCIGLSIIQFDFSAVPTKVEHPAVAARGNPNGPNIILVTIDTLRADHLGCYGYKRPTSPFLDSLAAEGTRFADASSAAPWTKPSTATILSGYYPSRHGALYHGSLLNTPDNGKTLAEVFQEKGYVTAGFVSNPNIKKMFKFDRGFDEFFDSPAEDTLTQAAVRDSVFGYILKELSRYQFNWKYRNDAAEINRHALAWLDNNKDRRFFLYLHYIDPHEPYSPPADYEKQFAQNHGWTFHNDRKRRVGVDLYDGEIRYNDDQLKIVGDKLKSSNIWDNTIIIVTSDHGEEFFEHGALGHGFSLYQEVIHVPLLMRGPGITKNMVVESPVGLVDLASTVLDVAQTGVTATGDGKSFANLMRDPKFKSRDRLFLEDEFGENEKDTRSFVINGLRMGPWKLVLNERNAYRPPEDPRYGREELYNLETDPGEKSNLFHNEKNREIITKLIEDMHKHATFLSEKGLRSIPPALLSPEIAAEMRRIGYLK